MKKSTLLIGFALAIVTQAFAVDTDSIRYHHENTDTTFVTEVINKTRTANIESTAERIVYIAKMFLGKPYVAETLEGNPEMLTINTSELDCTTFVENVMALAITTGEDTTTYKDFEKNLKSLRYRDGLIDGYASRLHYTSDWVADNSSRGNFTEVTSDCTHSEKKQIRLNYMSSHRKNYKGLTADQEAYDKIIEIEQKYNPATYSYIPKASVALKPVQNWLKEGDIILITTTTPGLDVTHMGIVVKHRGQLCIIHASTQAKKVVIEPQPLSYYLKARNNMSGIRVVRL